METKLKFRHFFLKDFLIISLIMIVISFNVISAQSKDKISDYRQSSSDSSSNLEYSLEQCIDRSDPDSLLGNMKIELNMEDNSVQEGYDVVSVITDVNENKVVLTSQKALFAMYDNYEFNMITNGDEKIDKVLAIMPDGKTGAPCGACRELMVQLMPDSYKDIEIMLDYETGRTITLKELTPEWWIKG